MIKNIEIQQPTRMTIVKNGNIVADIYVPGIKGGIDGEEIKASTYRDEIGGDVSLRLEV